MRVIYDFGANNGDDIPYYLRKCDRVVAVDANPAMTGIIANRFHAEIAAGRLVVLNRVLAETDTSEPVPFYLHRHEPVRSQFPRPAEADLHQFDIIMIPARRPSDIVREHGEPHYVKIDIEGYDDRVLHDLFSAGIRPSFISAESHHVDSFVMLAGLGGYRAFKLVDGPTVHTRYANATIHTDGGTERYAFPLHSAGPFGEDIQGPWIAPDHFFRALAFAGLGWKDIHAARDIVPDPNYQPPITVSVGCRF